ncbi:MAG: hypothetical protein ACI81T_002860 [Bacteroidia bacterium]|jgi:hypothetical protein
MKQRDSIEIIQEDKIQTVLCERTKRLHKWDKIILNGLILYAFLSFVPYLKPEWFGLDFRLHNGYLYFLVISSALPFTIYDVFGVRPIDVISIQITNEKIRLKGHPKEKKGLIAEIEDLRVLEMGDKEFWVVFNYGKKKKMIELLKNLDQESAEKAVDWLKGKIEESTQLNHIEQ